AKMTNVQRLRHANKNIVRRDREMQSDSWTKVFGPRKHSGLIEAQNSAFIGKTYRAISETFERHILLRSSSSLFSWALFCWQAAIKSPTPPFVIQTKSALVTLV